MDQTPIPRGDIAPTGIAMMALTSIVVFARVGLMLHQQRRLAAEDLVLYLYIVPAFFRLTDLAAGLTPPYATAGDDAVFIQKTLFAASACRWFCLWSAKFSLLCMYKKICDGLPIYVQMWWAVVVFSALISPCWLYYYLCYVCSSWEAWFSAGQCLTPRDIIHANISMWYAFAVGVLTDLMIMFLPIRLVMNLQMPGSRKIGIISLFCLGWILITASTIRVTQLASPGKQPTVPWLALWGTIEASIAIMIVSGPGLYRSAKFYSQTHRAYYAPQVDGESAGPRSQRSQKLRGGSGGGGGGTMDDTVDREQPGLVLKPVGRGTASASATAETRSHHSSQEDLVDGHGLRSGVMVRRDVSVQHGKAR
ncbi:hypothetical protein GGTG_09326 [Gaeumannomyces tritici R3-111a-1]|uniref:Rhodopsin domain-containing protein n=1 Tax=Gaeumannomyces tritici (strain R3-111a-1) TaxID=644352 RepID=J3P729_GAET3|nr:hypothetical protein GGTG_09326 [Gaeumannomyces tritici R3-111a-1]EJT72460.1 hypothetical protein GGTG_09326 [Gaeumannomyces tritici R3-111a-1]